MKINFSWLKELLHLKISNKRLIQQLIMLGLEVEKVSNLFISQRINKKFIVGKIIDSPIKQYNSKYFVYKIDFGNQIKQNIFTIQKINNYYNKKVIVILSSKLVNVYKNKSFLMSFNINNIKKIIGTFFFYNYFNLNEEKHYMFSIVEILENIPLGKILNKQLNIHDKCIKLNIAFNRNDLKNLIGICREIYTINKKNYYLYSGLEYSYYKNNKYDFIKNKDIYIKVQSNLNDFFYVGRIIKNIDFDFNQLPLWMYNRLLISESIYNNPLLNIINYVFIETGILINVFDLDIIGKELIITTQSCENNIYKTLIFTTNNKKQVLSIAGKLCINSNFVSNKCKNLYIESISLTKKFFKNNNFYNKNIFILDHNLQLYAINRVTKLINNLFGGNIGPIYILGNKTNYFLPYKISVKTKKIKCFIGQNIKKKYIRTILQNLNFKINIINNLYWEINPPVWRIDIYLLQDIIEEILKFYGFNKIKSKPLLCQYNINNIKTNNNIFIDKIKSILIHKGYQEIITYSLVDRKIEKLLFKDKKTAISIINPLSQEFSCLRTSLLNGLLKHIIYNINYQFSRIKVFELGSCYYKDTLNNKNSTFKNNLFFKEKCMLAGAIYGNKYERKWCLKSKLPDIYDIKGDIENIFEILYINPELVKYNHKNIINNIFTTNSGYIYFKNYLIGKFGLINYNILNLFKIKNQVIYFELNLTKIFSNLDIKHKEYNLEYSYLPFYERDMSFIVDNNIPINNIIKKCKKILKQYLLKIEIFDIYADYQMKLNNKKSVGINLILQNVKNTLNNKEINKILDDCIIYLSKKFGIILR